MISDKLKKELEERAAAMQDIKKNAIDDFIKNHGNDQE